MSKREPGERRREILQTLAEMLEQPAGERITTALLAKKIGVSEAALYRHFASKAQMYEGLIEFIEETIFSLINKIQTEEADGLKQIERVVQVLLNFSQKNIGMTRVLIGDALVIEDERLQRRMNQLHDRIEASLRQSTRLAIAAKSLPESFDSAAYANAILSYAIGRWHQFAKSGFKRAPAEQWQLQWPIFAG
jgi:TetR/AcrR family transcriptional regulator